MSNPAHRPKNRSNIETEQNSRIITELRKVVDNTDPSGSIASNVQIKGLTDISDTSSSEFVKLNSSGHIEVAIVGQDTAGDQSLHPVKVNDNGEVFTQIRPTHFTTLPTLNNGQGHGLLFDNKARLLTKSTLSGLTDIADETTGKNVRVNTLGEIATTSHMKGTDDTNTERDVKTDSTGKLITSEDKITVGNSTIASGGSLNSVLIYGRKADGTLEPLECNGDRLLVDVVELAQSGPISTSTSLSSVQICGYNESEPTKFRTLKVSSDGTLLAKDDSLNNKWETDITNNIKGDIDSINTSTATMDGKMTRGEGNITGGGSGLFQTLCYGKDQSGNLDPLNVDSNGHLKITINDIESGITDPLPVEGDLTARATISDSSTSTNLLCDTLGNLSVKIGDIKSNISNPLQVSKKTERNNIEVDENDAGGSLSGQIDAGDFTETIDIFEYKSVWISIASSETDSLELHASHSSSSGFQFYDILSAEINGGISYKNDCVIPRYLRIKNQNATFYSFSSFRVHLAR